MWRRALRALAPRLLVNVSTLTFWTLDSRLAMPFLCAQSPFSPISA